MHLRIFTGYLTAERRLLLFAGGETPERTEAPKTEIVEEKTDEPESAETDEEVADNPQAEVEKCMNDMKDAADGMEAENLKSLSKALTSLTKWREAKWSVPPEEAFMYAQRDYPELNLTRQPDGSVKAERKNAARVEAVDPAARQKVVEKVTTNIMNGLPDDMRIPEVKDRIKILTSNMPDEELQSFAEFVQTSPNPINEYLTFVQAQDNPADAIKALRAVIPFLRNADYPRNLLDLFVQDNNEQLKTLAKNDEAAGRFVKEINNLTPLEKEALKKSYTVFKRMEDAPRGTSDKPSASPDAPNNSPKKNEYTEQFQKDLRELASKELEGLDASKMDPMEKQMKIAQVMMKHGVSVTEKGAKFDVQAPKDGLTLAMNKLVGFISIIGALTNRIKTAYKKASGKEDVKTAEKQQSETEAKMRVDAEMKSGKTREEVKTETAQKQTAAKENIEGKGTTQKGLKEELKSAEKTAANAQTKLNALNTQRSVATDDEKHEISTKIIAAEKEVKTANEKVNELKSKIEEQQKIVNDATADLAYIAELEKSGGGVDAAETKPSTKPTEGTPTEPKKTTEAPKPETVVLTEAQKVEKQNTILNETIQRIDQVINRERVSIEGAEKDRASSGMFGGFNRLVTGSDPYAIEISNSKQKIGTTEYARTLVQNASAETDPAKKVELINQARRILGMRQVTNDFAEADKPTTIERSVRGTEHFDVEQQAIDVSRDVAIDSAVTLGTLGGGAAANIGRKGVQLGVSQVTRLGAKQAIKTGAIEGMQSGAAISAGTSIIKNTDNVIDKNKNIGDAVKDVVVDTAIGTTLGGVVGGASGGVAYGIGKGVEKIRTARQAKQAGPNGGPSSGQSGKAPNESASSGNAKNGPQESMSSSSKKTNQSTENQSRSNRSDQQYQRNEKTNPNNKSNRNNTSSEKTNPNKPKSEQPGKGPEAKIPFEQLNPNTDPYTLLGIKPGASRDEISRAFGAKSRTYEKYTAGHPADVMKMASDNKKILIDAYRRVRSKN